MSTRKLKDLPGWADAKVEAAKRIRKDGSSYQDSIGDTLRIVGAFMPPPSIDRVTADLVKALVVGVCRQAQAAKAAQELTRQEAEKVVNLREASSRLFARALNRRRVHGDWSETWSDHQHNPNGGGVPGL